MPTRGDPPRTAARTILNCRHGVVNDKHAANLRHTHAMLLFEEDVNVKVVSERLGHANISITLDTYSHILLSMQQHAADGIDAALFGQASPNRHQIAPEATTCHPGRSRFSLL
jgi:integrase